MKLINKITGFTLAAIAGFGLSACTNELNGPASSPNVAMTSPVASPDVIAWSGNQTLGNTFTGQTSVPGTRTNMGDGDLNNRPNWNNYGAEDLTNITDPEREAVLEAIAEKTQNGTRGQISEDLVFPWTAYFLQDVISGQNGNWTGAGSNGTSSSSYSFEAWKTGADCRVQSQWYSDNHTDDYSNYELVTNSAHLNNYYLKGDSQERINETTLMYDMTPGTYEEMHGRQFRWYINCHENLHWSEYIVVQVDGSYYICFDFGCGYPENDKDGHSGRGAEHNDWDYNDWILKITPAGNQPDVWTGETTPEQPEDKCDKCDHPSHEPGDCPQCKEEENCEHPECNPKEETPPPTDPEDCEHCHHPKHEGGYCPDQDCKDPNCTPIPDGAIDCPLCDHPAVWDEVKGMWVHWFDHTAFGEPCSKCKEEGRDSDCSDDALNNEMRGTQPGETPTPGTGNTPNQGTNKYENNEVEINLSLNDIHTLPNGSKKYDVADLVSKLSIHVRYPKDVEVILPVPEKFYCNQDDLYIFNAHYENKYSYGGDEEVISYNVDGNEVKLHIQFVTANDDELTSAKEGYIRVWTEGINEAVIKYCRENYGDGINFEIYNYYNRGNQYTTGSYDSITLTDLQNNYLNYSYVNFDPEHNPSVLPDFYINAYNEVNKNEYGVGTIEEKDCSVWIIGDEELNTFYNNNTPDQRVKFWNYYVGEHFNGSHFNWIYTNTSVKGSTDPNK